MAEKVGVRLRPHRGRDNEPSPGRSRILERREVGGTVGVGAGTVDLDESNVAPVQSSVGGPVDRWVPHRTENGDPERAPPRLVMPRYVASNVAQFGAFGLVFAMASWHIVFAN